MAREYLILELYGILIINVICIVDKYDFLNNNKKELTTQPTQSENRELDWIGLGRSGQVVNSI